jgi:acyl carrier protein
MVGAKYGVNLTAADLRNATTLQDLSDLIARRRGT